MAKTTSDDVQRKRAKQSTEPYSWREDAEGVQRFHCPLCQSVTSSSTDAGPHEHRWPRTRLAQQTLSLAAELAQDAWLVDQDGPEGARLRKVLFARLQAIHRASESLEGMNREKEKFVLKLVAKYWPKIVFDAESNEIRMSSLATTEAEADAEDRIQFRYEGFANAFVAAFGEPKRPALVRERLVDTWRIWAKRGGGKKGYVAAFRELWLALHGQESQMDTNAIQQLAKEFRQDLPKPKRVRESRLRLRRKGSRVP